MLIQSKTGHVIGSLAGSTIRINTEGISPFWGENRTEIWANLKPWQLYSLEAFKPEDWVDLPIEYRSQFGSGIWRLGTYEDFVYETVALHGWIASCTLSLLFKPKVIAEFGIYAGLTSLLFSKFNPTADVYVVDIQDILSVGPLPQISFPTGYMTIAHGCKNVIKKVMSSSNFVLPDQVDLCYIDGDHSYKGCMNDSLRAWENRNTKRDWCIAWDDYHPNTVEVYNAVNDFVRQVGMPLQKIGTWFWIGTKTIGEQDLTQVG
jgi:hypothetical protein